MLLLARGRLPAVALGFVAALLAELERRRRVVVDLTVFLDMVTASLAYPRTGNGDTP